MAAPAPAPALPSTTYKYPPKIVELRKYADSISKTATDLESKPESTLGQISAHALSIANAVESACAARSLQVLEPFTAVAADEIGRLLSSCCTDLNYFETKPRKRERLGILLSRTFSRSRSPSPLPAQTTTTRDDYLASLKAVEALLRIGNGQSQLVYSGTMAPAAVKSPAFLQNEISTSKVIDQVFKTALLTMANMTDGLPLPFKAVPQTVLQLHQHIEDYRGIDNSIATIIGKVDDFVEILAKPDRQKIAPGEDIARAVERFFRAVQSIFLRLEILRATATIKKLVSPTAIQTAVAGAEAELHDAQRLLDMALQVDTNNSTRKILHAQGLAKSNVNYSSELPASPRILHGRDEELSRLVSFVVDRSHPIRVAIMGAGGLGKTTLANAVVQHVDVAATFGARRFLVTAEAAVGVDDLLTGMLTTFGLSATSDALASLLRHLRSQDRTLLVIDNLETIWNSDNSEQRNATERVLSQLDEVASLTLIITCRGTDLPPNIPWANRDATTLSTLSPEAALATFTDIAPDVPAADEAVRDALLEAVDYMPLAVTLLARLVAGGRKLQKLSTRWESFRTSMLHTKPNGRLDNVDVSIQLSLDYLPKDDPEPLRLLSLCAQLPDGMRVPVREQLERLCGFRDFEGALDIIQGLALVYVTNGETIRMLSPIRLYVLKKHKPSAAHRASLLEIYCDLAVKAPNDVTAYSGAARDKILPELRNLESVLLSEIQDFGVTPSRALIDAIVRITDFSRLNVPNDRLVVALIPRIAHLPLDLGLSLSILSQLQDFRGNIQASIELALKARCSFESAGDLFEIACCDRDLGSLLRRLHNYIEADARLSRGRTVFLDLGKTTFAAKCQLELAHVARDQERYDEATALCTSAREEFLRLDEQAYVAQCQRLRGGIYYDQADYPAAARELESGLQVAKSLNVSTDIARGSVSLADVYIAQERLDDALGAIEEAYGIFREQGDVVGIGGVLKRRATVQWKKGNATEAHRYLLDAQSMYESVGYGVKYPADALSEYARIMAGDDVGDDGR